MIAFLYNNVFLVLIKKQFVLHKKFINERKMKSLDPMTKRHGTNYSR